MSVKSKSHRSFKSSKDKGSSYLSSINWNIVANKSKSSSLSRKNPTNKTNNPTQKSKQVHKSFDYKLNSHESFFPNFYYSVDNLPNNADSPLSVLKSSVSLKHSDQKRYRGTKTIRRNLLIFSNSKEKRITLATNRFDSKLNIFPTIPIEKVFTNDQNKIFKDLSFYEEGWVLNRKKHENVKKLTWNLKIHKLIIRPLIEAIKGTFCRRRKIFKFDWQEGYLLWDSFFLLIFACFYILLPIRLAFRDETDRLNIYSIGLLIIGALVLIFSTLAKTLVQFIENSDLFLNNKHGFLMKCLKSHLLLDSLAIIFLFIFLSVKQQDSLMLLFCCLSFLALKLPEAVQIITRIELKIALKSQISLFFQITLLIYRLLCFANLATCLWIFIGVNYKENALSWLSHTPILSNTALYFRCLTANLSNITLIGLNITPNLIIPVTTSEYIFNIFLSGLGFLFLWSQWRTLQFIFLKGRGQEASENLIEFERILSNHGLDYVERSRFTKELGSVLSKNKEQRLFGELLKLMSPSFQESLLMRIYWPVIKRIPVLSRNFTKVFLVKLLHRIKIQTLAANETLFQVFSWFLNFNKCFY